MESDHFLGVTPWKMPVERSGGHLVERTDGQLRGVVTGLEDLWPVEWSGGQRLSGLLCS